jgi:hypothetical protein
MLGRKAEAAELYGQYEKNQPQNMSPETAKILRTLVNATIAYLSGRTEEYARLSEEMATPRWLFAAAITRGDVDKAAGCIGGFDDAAYTDHLLLYSAAKAAGNDELAGREWRTALSLAEKDGALDPETVKLLSVGDRADPKAILKANILPDRKRIVLMAFGLACPDSRDELFTKASQLNVHSGFPRAFVDKILTAKSDKMQSDK